MHTTRSLSALSSILETHGAAAAIQYLNAGVAHRFTAAYRLDDGILRNLLLSDKQGEICPAFLAEVPLATSFCQFVLRDGVFQTGNSATDPRLDGHPYQGVMGSYVGLPLQGNADSLMGTFCHFDFENRQLPDDEFAFLQRVARLLPRYV